MSGFEWLAAFPIIKACTHFAADTLFTSFQCSSNDRAKWFIRALFPATEAMNTVPDRTFGKIKCRFVKVGAVRDRLIVFVADPPVFQSLPQRDRFARCLLIVSIRVATIIGEAQRLLLLRRLRRLRHDETVPVFSYFRNWALPAVPIKERRS